MGKREEVGQGTAAEGGGGIGEGTAAEGRREKERGSGGGEEGEAVLNNGSLTRQINHVIP